jgi:hypothetical protein
MENLKRVSSRILAPALPGVLVVAGLALWGVIASIPLSMLVLLQRVPLWTSGHLWRQVTCTLAFGSMGYALFRFRARHRLLYGSFEIMVALIGFWYALGTTTNLQGSAAAIIGGLYVLVRGFDNYKTGITDQHRSMGLDDDHRPLLAIPPISER